MRVRAERPPWYLSVVGGALYVRKLVFYIIFLLFFLLVSYCGIHGLCFFQLIQKASASSAALVSDYIGYLEKGQIPPKVWCLNERSIEFILHLAPFLFSTDTNFTL